MDVTEIQKWAECYDEGYDDRLQEIEQTLYEDLQEQEYITQDQLREVIKWKLDNQDRYRSQNIDRVNKVSDEYVRQISKAALLVNDPVLQLKTLSSIPGIGGATASVVLTFYDPENYAVGDRYMVDIFLNEDRQMWMTDYPKLLEGLRDRNPGEFDLRTVEKAYYQRYREQQGIA